jgi:hypothetical protein
MSSVVDELEEALSAMNEKREELLGKLTAEISDLEALRTEAASGREEVRTKVRAARRRVLGAEDNKRQAQIKTQDMRVRMRAPTDALGAPPPKTDKPPMKQSVSKIVVQGAIQRELGGIDARIVELFLDEDKNGQAPEVVFLSDLRAGLNALLKDLPEHGVLLSLVMEHVDQVQATVRDLSTGGALRARRFFDHDRELLGRLKAMIRADGPAKSPMPAAVEKLSQLVQSAKKALEAEASGDLKKPFRDLEDALLSIHRELQERGFVAARSLLFSALR